MQPIAKAPPSSNMQSGRNGPDTATGERLCAMFSDIVNALDSNSRVELADIVEYCHTRRALGLDSRALPVLFYRVRDDVLQNVARQHMPAARSERCACFHARLDGARGECSCDKAELCPAKEAPVQLGRQRALSECKGLTELALSQRMDSETKMAYVRARYYGDKLLCAEVGYRYLVHLEHPELPLQDTLRDSSKQPYVHVTAAQAALVAADEKLSDSDDGEDDDDDESYYSDEESFYSAISNITHESSILDPAFSLDLQANPRAVDANALDGSAEGLASFVAAKVTDTSTPLAQGYA